MVSEAERVPDQVGDVLRAKHAGSSVVLPTASAALCHLPNRLVCVLWRVGKVCQRIGGSRNSSWCQINTGKGVALLAYKTDWKALGGIREREGRSSGVGECLGREPSFSFVFLLLLPFPLFQQPCWQTEPLRQPIRHCGFEAARGCESRLVISPLLSTRSLVSFQASASLSRQDYYPQTREQCRDLKTLFNGQHDKSHPTR